MGRNLERPFIPSDDGSRLGVFFSNSFMFARSFLVVQRALRGRGPRRSCANPSSQSSGRKFSQYRGPFRNKSRELTLNHCSEPLNSFAFSRFVPSAPPMTRYQVQRPLLSPAPLPHLSFPLSTTQEASLVPLPRKPSEQPLHS